MIQRTPLMNCFGLGIALYVLACVLVAPPAFAASAAAESLDSLHEKAKKERLHPNAALLWARWATSEEGQKVYAQAGETPSHPNVEP
jgi:hypothetical protein